MYFPTNKAYWSMGKHYSYSGEFVIVTLAAQSPFGAEGNPSLHRDRSATWAPAQKAHVQNRASVSLK